MSKKNNTAISILIVDDQQLIIEGLTALLKDVSQVNILGGCTDTNQINSRIEELSPQVVIMDLNMPGKDGIECVKDVQEHYPDQKILMLTGYDDIALIREALQVGANGYVLKNVGKEELVKAIQTVHEGGRYLDQHVQNKIIDSFTDSAAGEKDVQVSSENASTLLSRREQEVLKLIAEGKKSAEIAEALFISINTVDTHRKNILAKCEVRNTAELISFATRNKMV